MDASGQLGLHSNTPGYVPLQNDGSPHPTVPPQLPPYSPQQPGYPSQSGYSPQPGYPSQPKNSPQHQTGYPGPPGFVIPAGYPNPVDDNVLGNEGKQSLKDNPPSNVEFTPPPSGVLVIGFDPVNMPPAPVHQPLTTPGTAPGDNAPGNEEKQPLMDNPPPNMGFTPPPDGVLFVNEFEPVKVPSASAHGTPTGGCAPPPDAVPSGGALDGAGLDLEAGEVKGFDFSEKSIRLAFVRKVYGILMTQLLVTFSFVAFCLLHTHTYYFFLRNPEIIRYTWYGSGVILICMISCNDLRRVTPLNYICLFIYTVDMSLLLGCVSTRFHSFEVLAAIGMTAVICLSLFLFTFQSKHDFTTVVGMLLATLVILIIFNIVVAVFPNMKHIKIFSFGVLIFSFCFIYDTRRMMDGKDDDSISPEEYIFAALNLYLDIVFIFLYLLVLSDNKK